MGPLDGCRGRGLLVAWLVASAALGCESKDSAPAPGQRMPVTLPDGRVCYEEVVYRDRDHDGFGEDGDSKQVCLAEGEVVSGYASVDGDCEPQDMNIAPDSPEICGDNFDENCDLSDERCPESLNTELSRPGWDCQGSAPDNVFAWARFADNDYYQPGACFVFFEGLPDEFYVEPVGLLPTPERAQRGPRGKCEAVEGCMCPSQEHWPYDRSRLYALTLSGDPDACDKIVVLEDAGDEQVVSNACRKFLYQIWFNENEYSFVGHSKADLEQRIERFPQVEIACFEGQPFDDLPFASLLTTPIELNPGFVKMK